MRFCQFLEAEAAPRITFEKVFDVPISWPEASRVAYEDDWFFFKVTCEYGGRTFTFLMTRHKSDRTTMYIDGLMSSGGDGNTPLAAVFPYVAEELKRRGITHIAWTPAGNQFGHHRQIAKGDPQANQRIRDRLLTRALLGNTGLIRRTDPPPKSLY